MDKEELFRTVAECDLEKFYNEIAEVQRNMEMYGGSFEQGLARALLHADMENAIKIKITWSDLWEKWLNWKKI